MRRIMHVLMALIILAGALPAPGQANPDSAAGQLLQAKVDPWVLQTASAGETDFLVFLTTQADLSGAAALPTKLEKGRFVYQALTETARRTQGPLLALLQRAGADFTPYWVANMLRVRAGRALIETLAQRSDVAHLYANPAVQGSLGSPADGDAASTEAIEWNIALVKADQVWAAGFTGQNVVIGGQDTGYDWTHPALKNQYRGGSGASADHNYNWHDAIHSPDPHNPGANPCGIDLQAPCDDYGHGTHTMGIMVGSDGGANQVGMAPGARWIGCRDMEQGWGKPSTYAECFQWFIAPTRLDSSLPDPAKAPDIINNSWGCPISEGCTDPGVLLSVVHSVTAAGILTVQSAGNDGFLGSNGKPTCGTVITPAAIYADSFTVANTTQLDNLASGSSVGPVTVDTSGRPKPDIAAPGTSVRSSVPGGGYGLLSGTSMSAPHVVGLAALLVSARPQLAGHPDELRWLIEHSANPNVHVAGSPAVCGGVSDSQVPNNFFGWGRIDAAKALQTALVETSLQAEPAAPHPGDVLTVTLSITNSHPLASLPALSIQESLPAGLQIVGGSQPFTQTGRLVSLGLPGLPAGTAQHITLRGQASLCMQAGANLSAQVNISGLPGLPVSGPRLDFSGLAFTTSGPASAFAGGLITYTLQLTNTQAALPLASLVVSSTLPAGLQLVRAAPAFSVIGPTVGWRLPSLAAGSRWQGWLAARPGLNTSSPLTHQGFTVTAPGLPVCTGQPVVTQLDWHIYLPALQH